MRLVHVCVLFLFLFTTAAIAQNNHVITGTIKSATNNESLSAISVLLKGSTSGTYTDEKGFFKLSFTQPLPVTLVISSIGYAGKEVTVSSTATKTGEETAGSMGISVSVFHKRWCKKSASDTCGKTSPSIEQSCSMRVTTPLSQRISLNIGGSSTTTGWLTIFTHFINLNG